MNANILHIHRDEMNAVASGDLYEGSTSSSASIIIPLTDTQKVANKRQLMGGNILIAHNSFSEISGCPNVVAGAILIELSSPLTITSAVLALGLAVEEDINEYYPELLSPQDVSWILSKEFA